MIDGRLTGSTKIEFKDVTFGYTKDENVLEEINITFAENTVNAIVGASGLGKSTFANLFMGFYQTFAEQVYILT